MRIALSFSVHTKTMIALATHNTAVLISFLPPSVACDVSGLRRETGIGLPARLASEARTCRRDYRQNRIATCRVHWFLALLRCFLWLFCLLAFLGLAAATRRLALLASSAFAVTWLWLLGFLALLQLALLLGALLCVLIHWRKVRNRH